MGLFQTGARKLQIILFFGHKSSILPGLQDSFHTKISKQIPTLIGSIPSCWWVKSDLFVAISIHFDHQPSLDRLSSSPVRAWRIGSEMPRKGKRAVGAKKDEKGMPVPMDKEITFSNLFLLFEHLEGKPMA